jgi:hypothetical protein
MKIRLELPRPLGESIHADLSRPHPHAAERVGFLTFRPRWRGDAELVCDAVAWHPVADQDYVQQRLVGACIGPGAFRRILEHVYFNEVGVLHVHRHDHWGRPAFSYVDLRSMRSFIPSFFNARAAVPHGAVVLSFDQGYGVLRTERAGPDLPIAHFAVPSSRPRRSIQ